ncbi:carboxymuconolactone decarboxylase family protein [Pelomicrobium sp.]|jgi:AhpD family alkylhydroperoxidase|uniref:carboxymuconolactone decarboxylase family protein n=1 Tax=Pelomicrobium sp. TaxID=2815319 RepID=UPI002FDDE9F1
MARLPLVSEETHPELAPLIQRIREERGGRLLNLYATLLHSPPVAEGWLRLLTAVRQQTQLDPALRELVILQVALLNQADYEYRTHVPFALQAGLTPAQLEALPTWRESPLFDPRARDVLAYVEAMTRDVHVPEALFTSLRRWFDPRQLVELTVTAAAYNMVSRFLEALQVEADR